MLLTHTPLPKGSSAFSSVHVVSAASGPARATTEILRESASKLRGGVWTYEWPQLEAGDVVGEYEAFFRITSELVLNGADRSSLLVFVASAGDSCELATATILAMLPFRGVQVAFVTPRLGYVNPLGKLTTASGLFEYDARQPERMGRCPVAAMFGPLDDRSFRCALKPWRPLKPDVVAEEKPAPFKIGALELPMVTFEGQYAAGVDRLASLLEGHFGTSMFPVVAVGETVDALGYGSDVLSALEHRGCSGHYFAHSSGESNKTPEAYGSPELLRAIAAAKGAEKRVVVIAVGGGVNGNTMGTVAAMIGAEFVEVPTTLMHYNDATTSAKKAFSLVRDGQILSKNILGTFYLPQLVYCISETFLTLCSSSVHAAVGEATKTMSMLGNTTSTTGQQSFSNILGGVEFASDFTRIMTGVEGFEHLIKFIRDSRGLKDEVLGLGRLIAEARSSTLPDAEVARLAARREEALAELRARFHGGLSAGSRESIMSFLTVINEEIIRAKAMFLAYSDPFEKYRALLFEYAHTLGHGIEAVMNGLYRRAEALNMDYEDAFRLHGQCVGMSVVLAGEMSRRLGHLQGDGFVAHQSLVYLFNGFGGYDFAPLRRLCDKLGVSREEFCEGVLKVVRRDNKRGYCKCAPGCSVDQLVQGRPGSLLRSEDPSAELRYLVEVRVAARRAHGRLRGPLRQRPRGAGARPAVARPPRAGPGARRRVRGRGAPGAPAGSRGRQPGPARHDRGGGRGPGRGLPGRGPLGQERVPEGVLLGGDVQEAVERVPAHHGPRRRDPGSEQPRAALRPQRVPALQRHRAAPARRRAGLRRLGQEAPGARRVAWGGGSGELGQRGVGPGLSPWRFAGWAPEAVRPLSGEASAAALSCPSTLPSGRCGEFLMYPPSWSMYRPGWSGGLLLR
ncbi:unnamed protein product [Prorocentrum cordatum]|uniref:3-dehydroquinate synthase N-terminal domain-containing protein n=1 Tax=Prorocentrum cordatum TaxID=2364126 RepID=A0ABN9X994_9DINO|nr:unnamed protein product [Polarella glacialis]